MVKKGQKVTYHRTPVRDLAVALSMLHAEIKAAGSIGLKQNAIVPRLMDATGISAGPFYREINRAIQAGEFINEGGHKKYRLLIHRDNYVAKPVVDTPVEKPIVRDDPELTYGPPAIRELEITVHKQPPAVSFLLNGVRVLINIP